jgi:hypothetical protein
MGQSSSLPLEGGGAGVEVLALPLKRVAREAAPPPEIIDTRRGSTPFPGPSPIEGEGR